MPSRQKMNSAGWTPLGDWRTKRTRREFGISSVRRVPASPESSVLVPLRTGWSKGKQWYWIVLPNRTSLVPFDSS